MLGQDLLRASPLEVQEYSKCVAAVRGMPPLQPCGKAWSAFQLLKAGARRRVLQYEQVAKAHGLPRKANIIFNSAQTVDFAGLRASSVCPALLRSSHLWCMSKQRGPIPQELFELQGHAVLGHGRFFCTFAHELHMMRDIHIRKLAGNGIHVACIEAALLFALACSVPLPGLA